MQDAVRTPSRRPRLADEYDTAMSEHQPPREADSETTPAALLTDHDPCSVLDRLPNNVFPMRLRVHLPRGRETDTPHEQFQEPDYPVSLREPETPYIPKSTVYFDNPAKRPPEGTTVWQPREFRDRLDDLLHHVNETTHLSPDDLTLIELEVAEVPTHFVTTDPDTGEHVVTSDLYEKEGEIRIARFQKEGSLTATDVRDDLEDALPGEARTPTRLTRVEEVHAKPSRHGRSTTASAGRAQFYTETDAEQVDSLELTPAVYQLRRSSDSGDRFRPLGPVLSNLDDLLPSLTTHTSDLVETVKFVGEEREQTHFHANEVLDS